MKFSDRVRRWWKPAEWRDEHPEIGDGEGFAVTGEDRGIDEIPRRPNPLRRGDFGDTSNPLGHWGERE